MSVSSLDKLPADVLIRVIQHDNDRELYPLISKKYYQLWLRAGHASINACLRARSRLFVDRPVLSLSPDISSLIRQSCQLDHFLKKIASSLAEDQRVLNQADRENLFALRRYRETERMSILSERINNNRILDKHFMDATVCGQLPVVKELLESPAERFLSVEILEQALHRSTYSNQKELVRLFLANPRISAKERNEALASTLWSYKILCKIKSTAERVAKRLDILRLFLAEPTVSNDALAKNLVDMVSNQNVDISVADRIAIINLLLAHPNLSIDARHEALQLLIWCAELSIDDQCVILERLLADPLLSIEELNETFHFVKSCDQQPWADRCILMGIFLNSPHISCEIRLSELNSSFSLEYERGLSIHRVILDHPSTTSSLLRRSIPIFESNSWRQSHQQYRQNLMLIANHREAINMPIFARLLLSFERAWAFLTAPFHAISERILPNLSSHLIVGMLFLPITLIRKLLFRALIVP